MHAPTKERRQSARRSDRTEMAFGASASALSNLSPDGAFVSVLAGLHPEDSFSFELDIDGDGVAPVRGRAVVVWVDPGVGAGVRFDLAKD